MPIFRGFEGEVPTMQGLDMYNAQGNYDQGRGADGLSAWGYGTSRYGTGVPTSTRPPSISGKPTPCPALDPAPYLPTYREVREPKAYGLPTVSPGLIDPVKAARLAKRGLVMDPSGRWVPRTNKITLPALPRGEIPFEVTVDPFAEAKRQAAERFRATPGRRFPVLPRRRRRPGKAETTRQRRQFVSWIKQWAPQVYAAAKRKADIAEGKEAALGQLSGWWETFTEGVTEVGGAVLQYKTQKAILDAQLERMRAGLPPLQTGEYAPTVGVKLDPGTTREITGAIGTGLGRMLPFIAIGGVALLLMMQRGRRRRR